MRSVALFFFTLAMFGQDFPTIRLHRVATGLQQPTDIAAPPDGSGRLFILEQPGRIRVIENGVLLPAPVLDISGRITSSGERGLLGIAFPRGFAEKRYFYVNYTDGRGDTVVSRFRIAAGNRNRADVASEQPILTVAQPYSNHNGGQLQFGPDGYLYIGMGDGGSANDPQNFAQNPNSLLGKMLRVDVEDSGSGPYNVPQSNPFANRSGYRSEIWALGVRNPWRFSFDRDTGDLWMADVGQNRAEEINFQPASSQGGENYGWRLMEGQQCNAAVGSNCTPSQYKLPVIEYTRGLGVSVTGGYIYRGSRYPSLEGIYFYGDYGSGRIWGLRSNGTQGANRELLDTNLNISTFGEDEAGELYVANHGGDIYLIAAAPPFTRSDAVVNAASYGPGLSPGALGAIFGTGLTPFNGIVQAQSFPLPTEIAGVSVTLNGTRVPLHSIANVNGQEQINFQVPFELQNASSADLVITANGASSDPIRVPLVQAQPEIFALVQAGNTTIIYATGLGPVSNRPASGTAAPAGPLAETELQVRAFIGGTEARVTYSGLAPGWAGLYQVNAELPDGPFSRVEVVLEVAGARSQAKTLQ
jgi:uncharacterized protein (TIGR03437 family)